MVAALPCTTPGAIAFTRTPAEPKSDAQALVGALATLRAVAS
jgi:hypothetical protein